MSYTVTVRRSCFCLLSAGPFRVTVVEGEVARVTQDRREIPLTDKVLDGIPLSIDQLFAYVDGARTAAGPDSVRVTYDPNLGYPTRIATSTIFFVSDSVITISVTDFQSHD